MTKAYVSPHRVSVATITGGGSGLAAPWAAVAFLYLCSYLFPGADNYLVV